MQRRVIGNIIFEIKCDESTKRYSYLVYPLNGMRTVIKCYANIYKTLSLASYPHTHTETDNPMKSESRSVMPYCVAHLYMNIMS